jgi:hypothetical protein
MNDALSNFGVAAAVAVAVGVAVGAVPAPPHAPATNAAISPNAAARTIPLI